MGIDCVDDGSTDNTKQIVNKISDNRIKYIYQENSERSAARNNGINHSNGEWICFLDSDDSYKESHLNNFYKEILKIKVSSEGPVILRFRTRKLLCKKKK